LSDECDVDIVGTWISEVTLSSCSGQCGVLGRQHQGGIRSLNVVQWARPFFPGPEAPEFQHFPCTLPLRRPPVLLLWEPCGLPSHPTLVSAQQYQSKHMLGTSSPKAATCRRSILSRVSSLSLFTPCVLTDLYMCRVKETNTLACDSMLATECREGS
jgi:hypothetical protein